MVSKGIVVIVSTFLSGYIWCNRVFIMATASPIVDFNSWNVSDLQAFLKERGVTYSKLKKGDLVELCNLARENSLETDPNFFKDSIKDDIKKKLMFDGLVIPDPSSVSNFSNDLSGLQPINNFDIYDYLRNLDVYPSSQLRDFKNLKGYKLYQEGYVESILIAYNVVGVPGINYVKFRVKPTQRKEDPISHLPFYNGWILLIPKAPFIQTAFCACKGGSDGGCRHTLAVLLELVEFAEDYVGRSVTSSACLWKKKVRQDADIPVLHSP